MSRHLDGALETIDAYFDHETQRSTETGYPTDLRAAGSCWRCLTNATQDAAELCGGCRAFLLGDDDVDPGDRSTPARSASGNIITLLNGYTIGQDAAERLYDGSIPAPYAGFVEVGTWSGAAAQFQEAIDRVAEVFAMARPHVEHAIQTAINTFTDAYAAIAPYLPVADDEDPVQRVRDAKARARDARERGLGHGRPQRPPRCLR